MREILISQKDVAALRAYKTDIKTMADNYGITVKDMRNVLVAFGFAKPTANTTDYVVTPVFDMNIVKVDSFNTAVESAENINIPEEAYDSQLQGFTAVQG